MAVPWLSPFARLGGCKAGLCWSGFPGLQGGVVLEWFSRGVGGLSVPLLWVSPFARLAGCKVGAVLG